MEDQIGQLILNKSNSILNDITKSFLMTMVGLLATITVVVILVLVMQRAIVSSLKNTIDILKDIAEGDGQLHKRLETDSKDEMGQMAKWFNKLIAKIERTVGTIQDKSVALENNACHIATVSSQMDQKMTDMRLQSNSVASAVEQLSMNMADVAGLADDMFKGSKSSHAWSQQVSENIQTINQSLDKSQESIANIGSSSQQMSVTIGEITSNTEESRSASLEAVNVVNEASTQVEELAHLSPQYL